MTPRGGWVAVWAVAVLQHDKFADLSLAQLGAWLRLRCAQELTNEPFTRRAASRLGVGERILTALLDARLLDDLGDGLLSIHDIEENRPHRYPSDSPEATRQRQAEHRARKAAAAVTSVTSRDDSLSRDLVSVCESASLSATGEERSSSTPPSGSVDPQANDPSDLGGAGIYYEVTLAYPSKDTTKDWANRLEQGYGADPFRQALAEEFRASRARKDLLSRTESRLAMAADRDRADREAAEAEQCRALEAEAQRQRGAERARLLAEPYVPAPKWGSPEFYAAIARAEAAVAQAETGAPT